MITTQSLSANSRNRCFVQMAPNFVAIRRITPNLMGSLRSLIVPLIIIYPALSMINPNHGFNGFLGWNDGIIPTFILSSNALPLRLFMATLLLPSLLTFPGLLRFIWWIPPFATEIPYSAVCVLTFNWPKIACATTLHTSTLNTSFKSAIGFTCTCNPIANLR